MVTLSPDLPDELVHEILFRLPPDEPACLFRLSVLSKPWRSLLADPAFHHLYRKFHRTPPMLGFIYNEPSPGEPFPITLVPTMGSCPPSIFYPQLADLVIYDCRHGRVLFDNGETTMELVVWDPMTDRRRELSEPSEYLFNIGAAVLCAVDGCDHATCHEGPFHVVFVGINMEVGIATAYKYSSETGEWSAPTSELALADELDIVVEYDFINELVVEDSYLNLMHGVLVEESLHFLMYGPQGARILKYDAGRHCLSVITPPAEAAFYDRGTVLMATEDGRLGVAHLDKLILHLWSREAGLDGVAGWTEHRVIDLMSFLLVGDPAIKIELIGSMEGANIIFATTDLGVYGIDLKLLRSRKLCEAQGVDLLFPFMSFYNPPERQTRTSS
ncbi:unnamed protein product [Alopecurus aequalis]